MDEATYNDYQIFVNYYIHQVNLIRYFLGEPYRATYADPTGVVMGGLSESGIPVTLEMTPYSTTLDWQEHALVCFEKGWVRVDLPAPLAQSRAGKLTIMRDPGEGAPPVIEEKQMPWIHAMRQQAMNFLAAVKGEREPMCTAAEALADMKVARAYMDLKRHA
jgi:predicted dehydrogenase